MLLLFFISQLAVVVLANPFHKYPYVFLLDVGNEEIEKVNTEQLRVTVPGGSLALKYPATGEGDLIGHVRVTGVDFGTDLKASIVQGGPGYKYVVLVFIGNPGVAYDAVVTIQTVQNIEDTENFNMDDKSTHVDDELTQNTVQENGATNNNGYSVKENIETVQASSNVYKYSNQEFNTRNNANDDDEAVEKIIDSMDDSSSLKEQDNEINNEDNFKDEPADPSDSHVYNLNENKYGKYEAFRPLIIGGVRFYPQASLYTQDYNNEKSVYDLETHASYDDGSKYKDSNNNDEFGSPVEY